MSIYHWLVILIVLLGFLMQGDRKGNRQYILLAVILMFCIMSLRDGKTIGNDSRTSYRWQFEGMAETEWEDLRGINDWWSSVTSDESTGGHERNFALPWLMKLVYELTDGNYQWFLAVVAAIVLGAWAITIQRYSPSPIQSFLYYLGLLYFVFQMSATKQCIAMSILLLSFPMIIERKPIRFILMVIFASFFHFPALVFLPAYWIANMKMGRDYLIVLIGIFAITFAFRDRIVDLMTDTYSTEISSSSGGRFLANKVIVMLAIIITALAVRPPTPDDRVYCALLQLISVAAVIQTFAGYNNTFERLADYYFQFSIIFIPMVFEWTGKKQEILPREIVLLACKYGPFVFCSFAIWRFLDIITHDGHFYPFRFFFQ